METEFVPLGYVQGVISIVLFLVIPVVVRVILWLVERETKRSEQSRKLSTPTDANPQHHGGA